MRKLYEILKILQIQKRIVSAEIIRGNTVSSQITPQKTKSGHPNNKPKLRIPSKYACDQKTKFKS